MLIITNDGRLTYDLTHPSQHHKKIYDVTIKEYLTDKMIKKLEKGIRILGQKTAPTKIVRVDKRRFLITLTEGKNRHIRRICRKIGATVSVLKRQQIGLLKLGNLELGKWRELSQNEVDLLLTCE